MVRVFVRHRAPSSCNIDAAYVDALHFFHKLKKARLECI